MEAKFKVGDRVQYTNTKPGGKPIPGKEYNIVSNGVFRDKVGSYEYTIAPASGNADPNDHYACIEEKYLILVNPSRIFFG